MIRRGAPEPKSGNPRAKPRGRRDGRVWRRASPRLARTAKRGAWGWRGRRLGGIQHNAVLGPPGERAASGPVGSGPPRTCAPAGSARALPPTRTAGRPAPTARAGHRCRRERRPSALRALDLGLRRGRAAVITDDEYHVHRIARPRRLGALVLPPEGVGAIALILDDDLDEPPRVVALEEPGLRLREAAGRDAPRVGPDLETDRLDRGINPVAAGTERERSPDLQRVIVAERAERNLPLGGKRGERDEGGDLRDESVGEPVDRGIEGSLRRREVGRVRAARARRRFPRRPRRCRAFIAGAAAEVGGVDQSAEPAAFSFATKASEPPLTLRLDGVGGREVGRLPCTRDVGVARPGPRRCRRLQSTVLPPR